ncbi:hypothetical protein [Desulfobacter vibrioformis]|uniref:hypothetical protein n=1 Tax=Desulfobacter vibrioformis TaxID=34031 RepID=UPI00055783BC|nr:hypothetical protein [Desulfobacter vibrioformis]
METKDKIEKLAIALTKETYLGQIKWQEREAPYSLIEGTNNIIPLFLIGMYKGKCIGLYSVRYKYYYDEMQWSWTEDQGICFIGENDNIIWEYSQHSGAVVNLFEAAREQASGINEIIDELLTD